MESPDVPPLRFYSRFFENDCDGLPANARQALFDFLQELQQNPHSPAILEQSEKHGDTFAIQFHDEYVIYWKLKCRGRYDEHVERIDVLKLARVSDLI